jgi:hypothetical protein
MNLTDELLRAGLREIGREIPARGVPALDLSAARAASSASARVRNPRSRSGWLTAVAAALAVVAVIALSALFATAGPARRSGPESAPPSGPVSTIPVIGTVPRYYAVLTPIHGVEPICLVIHNAETGATVATAVPPRHFNYVALTAAADDTTFVISALNLTAKSVGGLVARPVTLFLARFDPASKTVTLHRLPIPVLSMPGVAGIALSPDGSKLAVALAVNPASAHPSGALRLYSLTTGAVKTWRTPGQVDYSGEQGLSWGPGGDLGFLTYEGIWVLNTNAPAGNLLAASKLAVSENQPRGYSLQGPFALVDNGTEVISVVERVHSAAWSVISKYEVFSAKTGRVIRSFLPTSQYSESVWWANPAGTVVVGTIPEARGNPVSPLEWIRGSRHEPVKGAPAAADFFEDPAF